MGKKSLKKSNAEPPKKTIQLSQCMIVKNEEKNIGKALGWAKGIAFEQIVVDTGSTDRTVELAEQMGAKVYHFEWINDFSAAKNYAIGQATGNWIAFLDADEYLSPEDAKKMLALVKKIQSEPMLRAQYPAIMSPIVQLNDQGKPFGIDEQIRVYRNIPSLRYIGRIHEMLSLDFKNIRYTDDFSIMHTGYAKSVYTESLKADRNIAILREELAERPDDLNLKVYLADALDAKAKSGEQDGSIDADAEAEALYSEAAYSDGQIYTQLRRRALLLAMDKKLMTGKPVSECERMCLRALSLFPGDPDYEYYHARVLRKMGDHGTAWSILRNCETKLIKGSIDKKALIAVKPWLVFIEMVLLADESGDVESVVKYATMVLMENKTQQDILSPYIATMFRSGNTEEDITAILAKIYNMSDPQDVLFVAHAAKKCGAIDLARTMARLAGSLINV